MGRPLDWDLDVREGWLLAYAREEGDGLVPERPQLIEKRRQERRGREALFVRIAACQDCDSQRRAPQVR